MHVYTLVITPGPRRSAVARAGLLLTQAVPRSFDYWGTGGRFEDRLGTVQRPEIAAWYAAQAKRLERLEADHPPTDDSAISRELGDPAWSSVERPHVERLRRMQRKAEIDLTRLTSSLPTPLDAAMIPAALVTPEGRWRWRPAAWEQGDPRWSKWINQTIDRYRGGHCVVVADCHC